MTGPIAPPMDAVNINPERTSWFFLTELRANDKITGHMIDSNAATMGKAIFDTAVPQ
jgi:hypothetical protein